MTNPKLKVLYIDIEILARSFGDPYITMGAAASHMIAFGYKWEHEKAAHVIDLIDTGEFEKLSPF